MIFTIFLVTLALVVFAYVFMHQPQFGKMPSGVPLRAHSKFPNYKHGKFQNVHYTPTLAEDTSFYAVLKEFLFVKHDHRKPAGVLPSKKTNLLELEVDRDVLSWFGHSSYFIQIDGKKILVDPVLSGAASPIRSTTRSFPGSDIYQTDDIPEIDFLFVSHDHWDHLDFETMRKLKPKIKKIICAQGVGEHFEYWGFDKDKIIEGNWDEQIILDDGFTVVLHLPDIFRAEV